MIIMGEYKHKINLPATNDRKKYFNFIHENICVFTR